VKKAFNSNSTWKLVDKNEIYFELRKQSNNTETLYGIVEKDLAERVRISIN
jgi:hypothetical protein